MVDINETYTFDNVSTCLANDDPAELEKFLDSHEVRDVLPILYLAVKRDSASILSHFMSPSDADDLMRSAIMSRSLQCIRVLLDNVTVNVGGQHVSWRVFDTIMKHQNGHLHKKSIAEDSFARNLLETCTSLEEVEDFYSRYPKGHSSTGIDKADITGLYDTVLSRQRITDAERMKLWRWTENLEIQLEGDLQPKSDTYLARVSKHGTPEIAVRIRECHHTAEIDYVARRRLARQSMSSGNLAMYNYWISDGFPRPVRITRSLPVFRDACEGGLAELIELYWMDDPSRIPELLRHGLHTVVLNHWHPPTLDPDTRLTVMRILAEAISCASHPQYIRSIHALGWWEWLDWGDNIGEFDRRCIRYGLLHLVQRTWRAAGLYRRLDSQKS